MLPLPAASSPCHRQSSAARLREQRGERQRRTQRTATGYNLHSSAALSSTCLIQRGTGSRRQTPSSFVPSHVSQLASDLCRALGREANAALDFCLQGLKSFTPDSCWLPPLTQGLSSRTAERLLICCCCCPAQREGGEAARLRVLLRAVRKLSTTQKLSLEGQLGTSSLKQRLGLGASPSSLLCTPL